MVVIFIFMPVCLIFLCKTLREFILNESLNLRGACGGTESMARIESFLHGVSNDLQWLSAELVSPVLMDVSPWFVAFFHRVYRILVCAMIRIISALLLKETLAKDSWDGKMMVRKMFKKTATLRQELSYLIGVC